MYYEVHKEPLSRRSFNQEISVLLLHILSVFCVQLLFSASKLNIGMFYHKFDYFFSNYVIFSESSLINSRNLLEKQLPFSFFSCKTRICHHKFKLDA
jgi:hypothetical protein